MAHFHKVFSRTHIFLRSFKSENNEILPFYGTRKNHEKNISIKFSLYHTISYEICLKNTYLVNNPFKKMLSPIFFNFH